MNLKHNQISYIGWITFFIGLILIMLSWHFTYPIFMPELNEITFNQFYPTIWPGIILSAIGLFIAGYYSKRKSIKIICVAIFPIIMVSITYFFSYLPTSDSAGIKAMFEVFHHTGLDSSVEPYFQFPTFFTLNEISSQILSLNAIGVGLIFFTLFGVLISIYIFLFLKNISMNQSYNIAFIAIFLYFTGIFSNLNYQWVPQTLAFVLFVLLLFIFNKNRFGFQLLSILIFIALAFTHIFIPALFLLFLVFYSIKEKKYQNSFLLMGCIYIALLFYHATFYPPLVFEAFRESIYGLGEDYVASLSRSFKETTGLTDQIISTINRVRIPITWLIVSIGFLLLWIKKKISYKAIALGFSGGLYLVIGFFYPVLGTRSLQILFIPLVIGIGFYLSKWKKITLILVMILLILSLSGPMREAHDSYLFQLEEEEHACNFIADTIQTNRSISLALSGINTGYFWVKYNYINIINNRTYNLKMFKPKNPEFYQLFNTSIDRDTYVLYNSNLGREMISYGMDIADVELRKQSLDTQNKIYVSGKTTINIGR